MKIAAISFAFVAVGLVATLVIEWWIGAPASLSELGFGFGDKIGRVKLGEGLGDATRLPAIPYALGYFARYVDDPSAAVLMKNLLLLPLLGVVLARIWLDGPRDAVVAGGIAFLMSFPQLVRHTLALVPEEGWLVPILAFAFHRFLSIRRGADGAPLLPAALALAIGVWIKPTMLAIAPVLAALIAWKAGRARDLLPTCGLVCVSILILSALHLVDSGRFTPTSSLNGYELWKGNAIEALAHFPERSLDVISHRAPVWESDDDEWAWSRRCTEAALEFWSEHPAAARELFIRKFGQVFFRIRGEESPSDFAGRDRLKSWGMVWMFGFRIALWLAIGLALATVLRAAAGSTMSHDALIDAVGFIAVLTAFTAPYLIAWGTERRLMPMVIPVFLYLWSVWRRRSPSGQASVART